MSKFFPGLEFNCEYAGKVRHCVVERDEGSVVRVRIQPTTPGLSDAEVKQAEQQKMFRSLLISGIKFI